ncbi:MAG: hypothetical protein LUG99_00345 [Lachnospiraceae bacterium]|nr:hypothetical protein [Lachnospiraceae bacterium]
MEDRCVMCDRIIPEGSHVCPICQKKYSDRPAISRKDSRMEICPDCGTMEALDAAKCLIGPDMDAEKWQDYKRQIIAKMRGIR